MHASQPTRKGRSEPLVVDAQWVRRRLRDPSLRLVDLRGKSSHRAGHLPGAAAFDWDDLVDPVDGSLVGAAAFAGAMSEIGVGDDHVVVAYDQHEPSASLRLVWALRRYGHEAAYALVGGLAAWVLGGHPLARVSARPPRASFTARVRETPYERSAFVKTVRSNGAP